MDFEGIYETLLNFRENFINYTLSELKAEYDNYEPFEVGNMFHKLVEEGYWEVEKFGKNDYRIVKVLK